MNERLFQEFPSVTTPEWMEKITADLKGADYEKKLIWKTNDGFDVKPFYREEDLMGLSVVNTHPGQFPYVRGSKYDNDWLIRQDITVENVEEANKKALGILNKGVTSLGFVIPREMVCPSQIAALLGGIQLESVEINFRTCSRKSVDLVHILVDYYRKYPYRLDRCRGSVNLDYMGTILRKGDVVEDWQNYMEESVMASRSLPQFRVLGVNAFLFSNAGSSIVQELAYALAWGNELMLRLTQTGLDPSLVASKIKFNVGIGSNFFMEIAKLRAIRWLWAHIVRAYGATEDSAKAIVFAQTSTFNLTIYDAHVNMLRTQTEAMSAAIAGVDSLLIVPYDNPFKTPDDFSERIARNQQLLLKEEAHLDKVVDISGGSYYIENLTHSIGHQAWQIFLDTQEKGFFEMVKKGEIQQAVNSSANNRLFAVANRKEILVGTNQYPHFTEKAEPKITDIWEDSNRETTDIETLNTKRLAEELETLRLSTERSGKEVKVFMLPTGHLNMRLIRSQFACNFFACAGYQVMDHLGFDTVETGVEAAFQANADILVLCSSDEEYITFAPQVYHLTKDKLILVIAGAPACMEELKASGITHFIHIRSNLLDTLLEFNRLLRRSSSQ